MILSSGRAYVFVHIPKTGGTAMALALEGRAMKDDIMLGDTPKARKRRRRLQDFKAAGRLWKHSTLADIDGLVPILDGLFKLRVSDLLCMSNLSHASILKEHDNNDDFQGRSRRTA